ncbi:tRNA 2-selenouridine(34) synthase MnmH [Salipaludibacillus keqinensis]|uniref:tRNA 2-selenouridine(34) synthase MnmH n=2 Tax=Salipaludibacillus keqinensis TaxID=2045207 RepID=A0A323TCJ6_9BACI|nr:tRNA 2-selenouridine(34) synthase MnmH [Salipaludibacillus keqinensis]
MQSYTFPSITYDQIDPHRHYVIDVRSPSEYQEFHLPDSLNVPLFTDEERKQVGTIYKQESSEKAKKIGIDIYSKKLPEFYHKWMQLAEANPTKTAVVTCARGGMRSGSFVSMMLAMKLPVRQLEGGMRSVRKHVQAKLDHFASLNWKTIVLGGNTGTGKTKWLLELKERDYPVLDLEGLACHRGSVFGHIGLKQTSQKQFEFHLVEELEQLVDKRMMIIEAESKRIGRIIIPPFILENKQQGTFIEIQDRMERRVNHIMEDYQPFQYSEEIAEGVGKIKKRLPTKIVGSAEEALANQQYEELFELLLTHYYDPKYNHKNNEYVPSDKENILKLNKYEESQITTVIQEKIDQNL